MARSFFRPFTDNLLDQIAEKDIFYNELRGDRCGIIWVKRKEVVPMGTESRLPEVA